jgi:mono/diheme cytochrome c family protein
MLWSRIGCGLLCPLLAVAVPIRGEEPVVVAPAAARDFFESRIRPLFIEHCQECHGNEVQEGSLRLDHREGWATGGDSGPAIEPGDPASSLLMTAVRYEGLEMPPRGKLSDVEIDALGEWIQRGAYDPRQAEPGDETESSESPPRPSAAEHWAYRPLVRLPTPPVQDQQWPINEVDRYIRAAQEAEGLTPVADATRTTLARRLAIDLWGVSLPPDEVQEFVADRRPDAYERLVDRLLAAPQFGERWGRHWLDVSRFGESVTLRGFIYREAWRYRDYVLETFNRDVPFDRFVREQIAGDLLPAADLPDQQRQLVATTFLMLGNINYEEQDKQQLEMDVVDEQLDTIGKAFLAQTIGCARCHDHKFDPIPTRDYYAMAGILKGSRALEHDNVSKWLELPLPLTAVAEREQVAAEQAVAMLEQDRDRALERARTLAASTGGALPLVGGISAGDLPGIVVDSQQAEQVGGWQKSEHSKPYIGDGYLHDQDADKGRKTLTFHPQLADGGRYEVRIAYTAGANRAGEVPVTILHADGETVVRIDQRKPPAMNGLFERLGEYRFEPGNQGSVRISNEGTAGHVVVDAVQFVAAGQSREVRPAADAAASEAVQRAEEELRVLEDALREAREALPRRPMVMTVQPQSPFRDLAIHVRGSVHQLGDTAPRGVLQAVSLAAGTPPPNIDPDSCGRDALADWVAHRANPLTARVYVNRLWHWLFGAGLVRSVDNFGTTGESPSHAALLDHLAARFMAENWSTKWLLRELVTSRVYRLASVSEPGQAAIDSENRWWWRMPRRKLTAEAIRDVMLQASGELTHLAGGMTYPASLESDYGYQHRFPCRSVYIPVFRNAIPELLAVFDFPDSSVVQGQRSTSTVAPQALLLMNHPYVTERAERTAERLLKLPFTDQPARLETVYRWLVGRAPSTAEQAIAEQFLMRSIDGRSDRSTEPPVWAWASIIQGIYASSDFQYVE